ncbi:MAG: conjugal transfer protein TraX [Lachnospiraceae bacterium]|nr:conjugal transfer protein TraX [Lachnospiraceae bacterium]
MKRKLFSSSVLKNIAYLTMFIDHFFAVVFTKIIQRHSLAGYTTDSMSICYSVGRAIGRISFILFCYLAVESFLHTRSRRNYLLRLGGFALISEIPFDLAFSDKVIDLNSQNVFFTLLIGVFVLTVWEWTGKCIRMLGKCRKKREAGWYMSMIIFVAVQAFILPLGCAAAYYLNTDYRYMGVILIFVFYFLRGSRIGVKAAAAGCVMLLGTLSVNCLRYADIYAVSYLFRFSMREMYGLFAFVPIALYDGMKGKQLPKVFYYGFYPVHLLILHCIARMI